jgi:ABC-type antimicrobial peptide transport system permease subunit
MEAANADLARMLDVWLRSWPSVFIRQGLLLAAIGVGVGLAAAAGLTRLMSSLLFGVSAVDPLTYAAVSALLMAAAVLASYVPARRAMAIDPVEALRAE